MATPKDAPFKVAQKAARLRLRYIGDLSPVVSGRRSKPKRGPGSFRATKAAKKRARRVKAKAREVRS